jgi:hypothetical protein
MYSYQKLFLFTPLKLKGDFTMTVYDLIQQYADKSEEEQRQACVGSVWDLDNVDAMLDAMGYDEDCLDNDDKASCLAQAVEDGETVDEVLDFLRETLQEALDNAGVCSIMDDDAEEYEDDDSANDRRIDYGDDEHENGIEDDDDFLNR